ncbi:alpha/beta fold hydrolase [Neptunomonas antarctica]|uniref:Pimeloyl-ACP methyl ester carboxylesterase n=1 Tax=Neptunomonas antarctica TaxID=619304 RepID=A0A1N7JX60_9GAMM|nr:alpha/beta hydrolase [Neptunomonas antarctica]SIS53910.1 Pimeloyl-ACP methyl ester carboxylesterase [Neptunomonas antarctica]
MAISWKNQQIDMGHGVILSVRIGRHSDVDSNRPVLLFLHEALGCIAMWKDIPDQLAAETGCDVVVYERQGYGLSSTITLPRDDDYLVEEGEVWLPRLIDRLALKRVFLIGHSDGGSVALIAAASMPEQVLGVVTEAAHIYIDHLTTAGIEEAVERYRTTDLKDKLAKYHGERTDLLFRAWHETWLRQRKQPMNLRPWLPRIQCPALIIQGEDDKYGVPEQVADICKGIGARAAPLFLSKCGHVPHFEDRERLVAAVVCFVEENH